MEVDGSRIMQVYFFIYLASNKKYTTVKSIKNKYDIFPENT